MTDNGEVPQISDEDIEAFVKSVSEYQEREDVQAERARQLDAELDRVAKKVGYVPLSDPARHREAIASALDTVCRDCVEADVFPSGSEEMLHLAESLVKDVNAREHTLIMDALIIRMQGKFGMPEDTLRAIKRRTLVEAVVIERFNATDPIVQYVNHLIPGPVIDLEHEDLTAEAIEAFTQLTIRREAALNDVEESRQLIRDVGLVDITLKLRTGISMIVLLSKLDIAKNATMHQREERVMTRARSLGLDDEVSAKLLKHINEKYPIQ